MRVLIASLGGPHVACIVPLSWACQLAGHEVRVAVRPQGVELVTAAGLTAVPVGDEDAIMRAQQPFAGLTHGNSPRDLPQDWVRRPELVPTESRLNMANRLFAAAAVVSNDLVAFAREWRPNVIVHDTANHAGLVAASAIDVPAIGHTWGYSIGFNYREDPDLWRGYSQLFDRAGVDPIDERVWIDPCLPSIRDRHRIPTAPMRVVPYNGPVVAPTWLARSSDRPRVCITGGLTTDLLDDLVVRVAKGLQQLGAEIVITLGDLERVDTQALASLTAGVQVLENFPLSVLTRTCDLVVHHGGVGTMLNTAAYGVPQVVLPQSAMQDWVGTKIQNAGAGLMVDVSGTVEPDTVGQVVNTVLTEPRFREQAVRLQQDNAAAPAPEKLVGLLEHCAAGGDPLASPLVSLA